MPWTPPGPPDFPDNGYRPGDVGSGGVASVFGRTGAVVKQANDYALADITGLAAALALRAPLASPTFTGVVTVPAPSNATDPATKAYADALLAAAEAYADSVAQGLSPKTSAIVATAAALPANTYANGASGVGATLTGLVTGTLTVDGHVVALNERVLVKDEVAGANNGVYKCTVAGAVGVLYVLTRAVDMDVAAEFDGAFVFIETGTANGGSGWVCTNSAAFVVGTTAASFTQFSGAGEITAGTGLAKSGNTLSINTATTVDKTTAQTLTNKTLTDPVVGTQAAGDNSTKGASTAYADNAVAKQKEVLMFAVSDETTAITTGTAKLTFRMPFAMTLTEVRANLNTVSSSGTPTVDINESGVTILSTKLTIDATELTSTTAAVPAVISDAALADDAEITVDIDVAGTGAKGLKIALIGTRT